MAEKAKKETKSTKIWTLYEAKGELKRKNKTCPKCGDGYFLAKHKNRLYCGNCHYTEFVKE